MGPTVVWRRPSKRGARTPLVVLLHGRGADEYDLLGLADLLPPAFTYASLRGLVPAPGGGFTWFENHGPARPLAGSVAASVATVRTWLDDAAQAAYAGRCYLLGFSAGMMMAGALLLNDPGRFAGAVLLSGALAFDGATPPEADRLAGMPVFYGHGLLDDVIPPALAARTATYLRERSGAQLTVREYRHAHAISDREIADVRAWFEGLE